MEAGSKVIRIPDRSLQDQLVSMRLTSQDRDLRLCSQAKCHFTFFSEGLESALPQWRHGLSLRTLGISFQFYGKRFKNNICFFFLIEQKDICVKSRRHRVAKPPKERLLRFLPLLLAYFPGIPEKIGQEGSEGPSPWKVSSNPGNGFSGLFRHVRSATKFSRFKILLTQVPGLA